MKDSILKVLAAAGILAISVLFAWSINTGIEKNEIKECNTWAEQAKTYPKFYLTDWQRQQCDHYNIKVMDEIKVITKVGKASWYDYSLDTEDQKCRQTQDCYSQENDTCASRDYPRGTMLKVYNLGFMEETDPAKSPYIVCRVNDYVENPDVIIDLSSHAFRKLEDLDIGILKVEITEANQ